MITKYDKYFEDYMSAGDEPPTRRHREPIPYKQVVMTFLSQDFKDLVEKTKDSYDWDKFIDHCEKAEKLPYVCASNLKERLLNTVKEDIIKGVNPKLLDERDKPKDKRPKERYLKPRPESKEYQELQSKTEPKKTIDYSDRNRHLYDGGPFGDDVFDDENWGSAYEGMFIKFDEFISEKKVPKKYLTKDKKAMKDEIKKHKDKDTDDESAYGKWPADYKDRDTSGEKYKTKKSKHTKEYEKKFGKKKNEALILEEKENWEKALKNKAEETGISYSILKQVYNRGLAAWRTGHRPGATQHQWVMGRVNSFATGGKTRQTTDKDLWEKHKEKKD